MKIFINAATARTNTRNASVIHQEVRAIEAEILANVELGLLYANVTNGTTMTDSNVYYQVNAGLVQNATILDQIRTVEKYFRDLGYGVVIRTNNSTTDTITWNINW